MLHLMIPLIFLLFAASAYGHPGMTDQYGGHKCFKGCEEWQLLYAEYHLHDKDGKPIRVERTKPQRERKKRPAAGSAREAVPEPVPEQPPAPPPPAAPGGVVPQEEPFPLQLWLLLLAALLFLLLIARRRRREGDG